MVDSLSLPRRDAVIEPLSCYDRIGIDKDCSHLRKESISQVMLVMQAHILVDVRPLHSADGHNILEAVWDEMSTRYVQCRIGCLHRIETQHKRSKSYTNAER